MAKEAATKALADAKIGMAEVKQAVVGYVYGEFDELFELLIVRKSLT